MFYFDVDFCKWHKESMLCTTFVLPGSPIGRKNKLAYAQAMHEMSLTASILDILREEMQKHGKTTLLSVRICYGVLANVVPESLHLAFEVLTKGTDLEGTKLHLEECPLVLACGACHKEFSPEPTLLALFAPCPYCAEDAGHRVLSGKELYIDNIEVE